MKNSISTLEEKQRDNKKDLRKNVLNLCLSWFFVICTFIYMIFCGSVFLSLSNEGNLVLKKKGTITSDLLVKGKYYVFDIDVYETKILGKYAFINERGGYAQVIKKGDKVAIYERFSQTRIFSKDLTSREVREMFTRSDLEILYYLFLFLGLPVFLIVICFQDMYKLIIKYYNEIRRLKEKIKNIKNLE